MKAKEALLGLLIKPSKGLLGNSSSLRIDAYANEILPKNTGL